MRQHISAVLAIVLLGKQAIASPHHGHGHVHKRVLDVVTDWDVVYQTITDVVWVTVTGDDGSVTTTTTPAAVANVQVTTTTSVEISSAAPVAPVTSVAAAPSPPSPVASSPAAVVSDVVSAISSAVATPAAIVSSVVSVISSAVAPPVATPTTLSTVVSAAQAATSTTATPATTSSTTSSSSSKRGLSYNDASLLDLFTGATQINWCYNWGSTSDGTVPSGFEYVPMLWGLESSATDSWNSDAKSAIADGATALLAFNEPDNPSQANISPADAAAGYIQYMNPLSGSAQLGAPAITNGGGSEGITWLENFISACNGECDIDFVPIHWYDSATNYAYFKEHVQQAYVAGGNRTVWITEFAATGTTEEQVEFLQVVMPWLDEQEFVGRYAYFMDDVGVLLESISELSELGSTFMTYTSSTVSNLIADA